MDGPDLAPRRTLELHGCTRTEAAEKLFVERTIADRYGNLPDLAATVTTVIEDY